MSNNPLDSSMSCAKHNEEFKLYCQDDQVPICIICIVAGRHKTLTVVTLNEMLKQSQNTALGLQNKLSQKYKDMITTLNRAEDETMSSVKAEQMKIIQSLNESLSNSEKEADKIELVIEQISNLGKDGDIYKIMKDKQDILTRVQVLLEKPHPVMMTIKLDDNFLHLAEAANKLERRLMEFLVQMCPVSITLDMETAHPTLEITDDKKAVLARQKPLVVPASPVRFTQVAVVLATQGFGEGKRYWEVTMQDTSDWSVGVVKKSMPRNGSSNLMNSPLAWSVAFQQSQYLAWHNSVSTPLDVSRLHRLGLFLDFEGGQLTFYDANTMTPMHTFSALFNEPVYPAFNPGTPTDKTRKAILILQDVAGA
ncbi:E3 ubiquitin-protein ligase TRIM39-like isoform X2 [Narcine bancroftii]|uniref:E3 ubiquitin-protein ligase TRIM39-like isoform X2 n=1 Tax=Narcine bancroftii TaxID=1343680 RepID=UPI003831FB84